MSKTLPILAIVGAALTTLGIMFSSDGSWLLIVHALVVAYAGVLCFSQEPRRAGMGVGIVLLIVAVLDLLSFTEITTKKMDLSGLYSNLGASFIVASTLLAPAVLLGFHWDEFNPTWLRFGSALVIAVAFVVVLLVPDDLMGVSFGENMGRLLPAAILSLLCLAPGIVALRNDAGPAPAKP